uniref:hypothetical protein n=1 Tax=Saccharothrix mutabilis TaxID=33921 RepID=UPI0031DD747D
MNAVHAGVDGCSAGGREGFVRHPPRPVSRAVQQAGLTDAYRVVHPDPVTKPGTTWSPVYPRHNGSTGVPEPRDRIDFVQSAGRVQATSSEAVVLGTPTAVPSHQDNLWSSDHAAVTTRFRF